MAVVDLPLQVGACACNANVVGTTALFAGVLMTTLCDETLMLKSVSQYAPLLPQAFTRIRWVPVVVETSSFSDVAETGGLSVWLSKEYVILAVVWPPHVGADAFSRNVLGTVEPFTGDDTDTPVPTVMATSFTQNAPPLPQDFTRSVCVPCDAVTVVLIDVAGLNMVSVP